MGCCQSREEEKKSFTSLIRSKSESPEYQTEPFDTDQSTMPQSRSSADRTKEELGEKPMLQYADTCYKKQKWENLAPMILNNSVVVSQITLLAWSEKPKSINSVALIYLAEGVKKFTMQVAPYIEVFLSNILNLIRSGSNDQKELAIYLMHNYIDYASEKALEKIYNNKIFLLLGRWMLSPKGELRKYVVNLCYKLYKNNLNAKEEFIEASGAFYLVQLIAWSNSYDFLEDLIKALEEVIMDNAKFLIIENLNRTREPRTLEILEKIDLAGKSIELKVCVERLVKYYRGFSGGQTGRCSL
jgi:hypothetical protein